MSAGKMKQEGIRQEFCRRNGKLHPESGNNSPFPAKHGYDCLPCTYFCRKCRGKDRRFLSHWLCIPGAFCSMIRILLIPKGLTGEIRQHRSGAEATEIYLICSLMDLLIYSFCQSKDIGFTCIIDSHIGTARHVRCR